MITWTRALQLTATVFALLLVVAVPVRLYATAATATGVTPSGESNKNERDIVETAVAGEFNTLVAAIQAAGLVETLKSAGPFTVFAPTDEAFAKLPAGTVETLLKPENRDQLIAILTYHVVPGEVTASEVVKLTSAATVQGAAVQIQADGHGVKINDARVVKTDIQASNGVVHVIDTGLLPPAKP